LGGTYNYEGRESKEVEGPPIGWRKKKGACMYGGYIWLVGAQSGVRRCPRIRVGRRVWLGRRGVERLLFMWERYKGACTALGGRGGGHNWGRRVKEV
jgi:hypothetical protein